MSQTPDLVPVKCPTCGIEFDVSHLAPGTRTACPKCRTIVAAPGAVARVERAAESTPAPLAAPPVSSRTPAIPEDPPPAPPVAAAPPPVLVPMAAETPAAPIPTPTPAAPAPVTPSTRRASAEAARPPSAPGRGLAVAALVVGLLSFLVPGLGIIAVGLGLGGLARKTARGLAVGGLVTGLLAIALHVALYVEIVVPRWERTVCLARVTRVRGALDRYRRENGKDASSISDLVAAKVLDATEADCPSHRAGGVSGYVILAPEAAQASGLTLAERADYHGVAGRVVLTREGTAEFRPSRALASIEGLEPPSKEAAPRAEKRVALEIRSKTWRKETGFDVRAALQKALVGESVDVVPADSPAQDGLLEVDYVERRGSPYTSGAFATAIDVKVTLSGRDRAAKLLSVHFSGSVPPALNADPAAPEESLYRGSLEDLRCRPAFLHLGPLVGAALGIKSSLPRVIDAVLRKETRETALDLLEKSAYRPGDPRGRAALALAREEYEGCPTSGAPAIAALAQAFREYADFDRAKMARLLGNTGEPTAAAPLIEYLESLRGRGLGEREEKTLEAVIAALGVVGDESAIPALEEMAAGEAKAPAHAAQEALKSLQGRLAHAKSK